MLAIPAVMAFTSTYFREIIAVDLVLLPVLIAEITLVMIFFNIPILYSVLVSITGYLLAFLFETVLVLVGSSIGITSQELMATSPLHVFVLEMITALLLLLISLYLQKKKIGFHFMVKHLSLRESLKGYNFILSTILILGIIGMQLQLIAVKDLTLKIYFPIILSIILLFGIIFSYIYNKRLIRQKYERFKRNEHNR
jgi:hypothetical protein